MEVDHWRIINYSQIGEHSYTRITRECVKEINQKYYAKIVYFPYASHLLREDLIEGKIYYYDPEEDEEYILFDYNVEEGDTLLLYNPHYSATPAVTIIDDIYLEAGRLHYQTRMNNFWVLWIAGIGSKYGPLPPPLVTDPDWGLRCAVQDGIILFEQGSSGCNYAFPVPCESAITYTSEWDLEATSVILRWGSNGFYELFDVRIKKAEEAEWNYHLQLTDNRLPLTELEPGATYEWQIKAYCCNATTPYSDAFTFTTPLVNNTRSALIEKGISYTFLQDQLTIRSNQQDIVGYELIGINGQLIQKRNVSTSGSKEWQIAIPNNYKGILLCRVFLENNSYLTLKLLRV